MDHRIAIESHLRQLAVQTTGVDPVPIAAIAPLVLAAHVAGPKFVKLPCVAGLVRKVLYHTTTAGLELADGSEYMNPFGSGGGGGGGGGVAGVADATAAGHPDAVAAFGGSHSYDGGRGSAASALSRVVFCLHRDVYGHYPFVLEAGSALILQDVTAITPPAAAAAKGSAMVVVCLRNVANVMRSAVPAGDVGGDEGRRYVGAPSSAAARSETATLVAAPASATGAISAASFFSSSSSAVAPAPPLFSGGRQFDAVPSFTAGAFLPEQGGDLSFTSSSTSASSRAMHAPITSFSQRPPMQTVAYVPLAAEAVAPSLSYPQRSRFSSAASPMVVGGTAALSTPTLPPPAAAAAASFSGGGGISRRDIDLLDMGDDDDL